MARTHHDDGEVLTLEQKQTERGSPGEKDPADGDGPLTVGEVSPAENQARAQEVPLRASQTTNPSEESQVDAPDQVNQNLSPNEVREQAQKEAAKRPQAPEPRGRGR